jgi:hypothetical protein
MELEKRAVDDDCTIYPQVKQWLSKHRRFKLHFTPTSPSWLNLVERWFGKLIDPRIRRGSFFSVAKLEAAIEEYLEETTNSLNRLSGPPPLSGSWPKVNHCKAILETQHYRGETKLGGGGTKNELAKPLIAVQQVRVLPDQSRADRSVALQRC